MSTNKQKLISFEEIIPKNRSSSPVHSFPPVWYKIAFLVLMLIHSSSCTSWQVVGSYSKDLGHNYSEILSLRNDSSFSYISNQFFNTTQPYMPTMVPAPDSVGEGTYTLNGNYINLYYTGPKLASPIIQKLDKTLIKSKHKIHFSVLDGYSIDSSGLAFTTVSIYDLKKKVILGSVTDLDGIGELSLSPEDFPCFIRFSFIGILPQELYLDEATNYQITVTLSEFPQKPHGKRRYKIFKEKKQLIINGMKK